MRGFQAGSVGGCGDRGGEPEASEGRGGGVLERRPSGLERDRGGARGEPSGPGRGRRGRRGSSRFRHFGVATPGRPGRRPSRTKPRRRTAEKLQEKTDTSSLGAAGASRSPPLLGLSLGWRFPSSPRSLYRGRDLLARGMRMRAPTRRRNSVGAGGCDRRPRHPPVTFPSWRRAGGTPDLKRESCRRKRPRIRGVGDEVEVYPPPVPESEDEVNLGSSQK